MYETAKSHNKRAKTYLLLQELLKLLLVPVPSVADPDPGSGAFLPPGSGIRIRDGAMVGSGSGIRDK
jgi:hypothetical protein